MGLFFAKASTTAGHDCFLLEAYSHRTVIQSFPSPGSVVDVCMHYFYVSSRLDTAELQMVERCLCQTVSVHTHTSSVPASPSDSRASGPSLLDEDFTAHSV